MRPPPSPAPRGAKAGRVGPGFMAGYAVAQTGALIGFVPLLSILLPLKVQAIAPAAKVDVLSPVLAAGAMVASLVNILVGAWSDGSVRAGRARGGWISVGAAGVSISLLLIGASSSVLQLSIGLLVLQVFLNVLLAPLCAVLADRVPDAQKGVMAGWLSLNHPMATLVGALLIGGALSSTAARYGALAVLVPLTVLPFAWRLHRTPALLPAESRSVVHPVEAARGAASFRKLWLSRFFMQCAVAPVSGYLLYYVEDVLGRSRRPEAEVAILASLMTLAAAMGGPLAGHLAHRDRRARLGLLAGLCAALGFALLALGPVLATPRIAMLLAGAGYGAFSALDTALAGEISGRLSRAGRDLGLLNLAHTAPQVVTPLWAWLLLHGGASAAGYAGLFGSAAAFSLVAGFFFAGADAGAAADPRTTSSWPSRAAA